MLDDDGVAAVDHADGLHADRADGAGLDDAARDLEPAGRDLALVGLADLVELTPSASATMRTAGPHVPGCTPGSAMIGCVVERLPEAEHVEHHERHRVLVVAEDLLGPHRADRRDMVSSVSTSWSPAKPGSMPDA